jgi:hypothetical protein
MMRERERTEDDEAISVLIGYVVNLAVAATVIGLTLFLLQGAFTDIRGDAVEAEMTSIGSNLADEIERVDVLSRRGGGNVSTAVRLPTASRPYTANVTSSAGGGGLIVLTSGSDSVEVGFRNETAIRNAGDGIELPEGSSPRIRYNETGDVIEIG